VKPKAVIFGCQGPKLTQEEKVFFERTNPLGFILFSRNCVDPLQVRELIYELRQTTHRDTVPILIDQEGGRVARLGPPFWRKPPPAMAFTQLAEDDLDEALWCARANSWLIGQELLELGINVNCAPVLDLVIPGAHDVIGDRSYGSNPELVAQLAFHVAEGLIDAGVMPVIKHLPGHGRATVDSHKRLPIVRTTQEELLETDFLAFTRFLDFMKSQHNQHPWGMTAHIIYTALDEERTATHSSTVIEGVIRGHMGFGGFLLSDCVTMHALEGTLGNRTKKAIDAGCDAVLHCSGILDEMLEVACHAPVLSDEAINRFSLEFLISSSFNYPSISEVRHRLDQSLQPYLSTEPSLKAL
jgi:beta-N-acetylhexosaminidase